MAEPTRVSPHPWFAGQERPRVLAHRGFVPADAEGVAENSVAALAAARGTGTVYLESDCHLTSDGVVVLFHDGKEITEAPRDFMAGLLKAAPLSSRPPETPAT